MALHTLSFALLAAGALTAPMFLSDTTPGSTPQSEVALSPHFAGLGDGDFGPSVPEVLQTAGRTDHAPVYDGTAAAFGTVSGQVSAVPEPAAAAWLLFRLLLLALAHTGRRQTRRGPAAVANLHLARRMNKAHTSGLACLIRALSAAAPSAQAAVHGFQPTGRAASGR